MSATLHNAASVTPPISGSKDMIVLASSLTPAQYRIPSSHLSAWYSVQADGCDVYVAFATDAALAVDQTDVTTLDGSDDISAHGTAECWKVPDGTTAQFDLSQLPKLPANLSWYLCHVESAASAYVRVRRSSGMADR